MGQRTVINDAFIDSRVAWFVIEQCWNEANISEGFEAYEKSVMHFSQGQRLLVAAYWHWSEVGNGGHAQFFFNSAGIVWKDALAGYRLIDASNHACILREAVDRLGGDPPLERNARIALLEASEPDFSDLDQRYHSLPDLNDFATKYVRSHRGDFYSGALMQ